MLHVSRSEGLAAVDLIDNLLHRRPIFWRFGVGLIERAHALALRRDVRVERLDLLDLGPNLAFEGVKNAAQLVASNGGTISFIEVAPNYIDVTLESTSNFQLDSPAGRFFRVTPQPGAADFIRSPCSFTNHLTLSGTGASSVVRIELVTTVPFCPPTQFTGGGGGGGGFSPTPANANSNGIVTASSGNSNTNGTSTGVTLGSEEGEVEAELPFTDVAGHWAQSYITQLYRMKIVQGRTMTTFAPDEPMTRAEVTKVALLLFGYDVPEATSTFADVPADAWYAKYVAAAKTAGIVDGYNDNTFHPDAEVNRAEALKIMLAASKMALDAAPESPFFDVASNDWYAPYVSFAFAKEIVSGKTPTRFAPEESITRAEMTKIALKTFLLMQQ